MTAVLALAAAVVTVYAVREAWRTWRTLVDTDPFAEPIDGLTDLEWSRAQTALRRIGALP